MKLKLILLALLAMQSSKAQMPSIVISASGGASVGKVKKNEKILEALKDEFNRKNENSEAISELQTPYEMKNRTSFVVDTNIAVTFSKDKFFFGIAGGYMHNFCSQSMEGNANPLDKAILYKEHVDEKFKTKFDEELKNAIEAYKAWNKNDALKNDSFELFKNISKKANAPIEQVIKVLCDIQHSMDNYEEEIQEHQELAENKKCYEEHKSSLTSETEKKLDAFVKADMAYWKAWNDKAQNEKLLNTNNTQSWINADDTQKNLAWDIKDEAKKEAQSAIIRDLHQNSEAEKIADSILYFKENEESTKTEEFKNMEKIESVAKTSISAQHSHMFYAGAVFGYNFTEKVSTGLSLNYVASSVSAKISYLNADKKEVEGLTKEFESEIFHGVMPTIFASYAIGKGISAKVSAGYAIFFDKDAQIGKASEAIELGNVFMATVGVSFKAM